MNEKISIVIPAYNVEKYIDKCLESVVGQTYKKIEIILVNDGSKDNTPLLCEKWKEKDERIIYISQTNKGLSGARNTGIDKATGKYIVFIDSDDWIESNMIEIMYNNLVNNNANISICNRWYYYEENGKKSLRFSKDKGIIKFSKEEALMNLINMNDYDMSAWCKMYDTSFFKKIKFPEGKLCEDYYIMCKIFDMADSIVYDSTPLCYYVQRSGSISKKKELMLDYIEASKIQNEYIERKYPSLKVYSNSALCLSFLTVYNKGILNHTKIEKNIVKEFKNEVKMRKTFVYKNDKIDYKRKMQVFLFVYFRLLYNLIVRKILK
ncbi:MAG: glycosyltransferase family 2 protein [Firmicutes bacterium]|nr:glycosyltransferase family 2 protein [Bacillota bacterium]